MELSTVCHGHFAGKNRAYLLLTLIAAGLLGNYFKFPIFLNIDFLFGSIFALLALQFCGLRLGITAAAIIASYTYTLWNHPYTIIILTAEVLIVGLLMERRKIGMVLADTLYWLFIGMPLVYLFYHVVMLVPASSTHIVMIKQAMNGIANALIARLLFTAYLLRTRQSLISFREIIYNLLAFFVLFPALILLGINSRSDFNNTDQRIRSSLQEDITRDEQRLQTWIRNRKSAIINLAAMASTRPPQQMQPYLELARQSDLNFIRIGLQDQTATTTAYTPLVDELGKRTIGTNYADRPFIPTLRQTLKPMLSEVSQSRIGLPKPRVLLLAPVVNHGTYAGFVAGILSLDQLRDHLDKSTAQNAKLYTLIDKNNNVIMSNRPDQQVMTPFTRLAGKLTRVDAQISQWIPQLPPNTPISERWQKSYYVMEAEVGDLAEWKLILEQPIAPFQNALYKEFTGSLTVLFAILLGSLALAELLSRRANIALEQLLTITKDLPARMASTAPDISWPESRITETNQLIANFQVTSDSLASQYREVQQSNEQLEFRVQERTAAVDEINAALLAELRERKLIELALGKSEKRFRRMIESSPNLVMMHCAGKFTYLNPKAMATFGANTSDQLLDTPVMERVHPDYRALERERIKAITELGSQASTFEEQLLRLDNSAFYASVTAMPFEMDGDSAVLIIAVDISTRKQVEKALLELNDTLEQQVASRTKELEATNKDLASFSYSISHELRAPIARLEGFSRILTECVATAETANLQHYAERIGFSSRRLMTVVDSLLLMNRIPRLQLQRESVDLSALSREICQELQEDCTSQHFLVEIVPNLLVQGDRTMLQVCMQNLLGNAFKYSMKVTDPAIIVGVTGQDHRPVYFVRDNGAGFDMAFVSKLFQPFSRLHNDHEFEGTGIGLATAQKIIEKHSGQIWADARPGSGATFFFTLG